jgi:hypothetical protein
VTGDRNQIVALAVSHDGRVMATGTLGPDISLMTYPLKVRMTKADGSPADDTADLQDQMAPPPEPEKDLSALQGGGDAETLAYNAMKGEDPVRVLARLQTQLNTLLKGGHYCQNVAALDSVASQILLLAPYDKAAYHALVNVGIVQQDLKMIYLMSRIGQRALFMTNIYDYDLGHTVDAKLTFWQTVVFNPAVYRAGRKVVLDFNDCSGKVTARSVPAELVALDLPTEVLRTLASRNVRVNFQQLKGLETDAFVQRVLYLSDQAMLAARVTTAKPGDPPATIALKDLPDAKTGVLDIDLSDVDIFGYPGAVPFQLRRERGPWMSYYSDGDRRKHLIMTAGNYYLRVDNKVRNVYSIQGDGPKTAQNGMGK